MENQKQTKIYTYRYFWENRDGSLSCRYLSGTLEEHCVFQQTLRDTSNVVSAMREYIHEVDYSFIGFTEPVKEKENIKEEEKNETL